MNDDQWPRPVRPKPSVAKPLLEASALFGIAYAIKRGQPCAERRPRCWAWRAFPFIFLFVVILGVVLFH